MTNDAADDARLVQVARRVGSGAADRLDVERAARAVLARLAAEPTAPAPRGRWPGVAPVWLRVAAALALVVGAGAIAYGVWGGGARGAAAPTEVADLTELSAGELHALLQAVEAPRGADPVSAQEVGLDDLSLPELRALLAALKA